MGIFSAIRIINRHGNTLATNINAFTQSRQDDTIAVKMQKRATVYAGVVIKTINQEGALFEDFKRQPKSERQYRAEYMDWARKKGMYVRGIEYCKKTRHIAECKAYYKLHGWKGLYISKHTDLRGD